MIIALTSFFISKSVLSAVDLTLKERICNGNIFGYFDIYYGFPDQMVEGVVKETLKRDDFECYMNVWSRTLYLNALD